MPTTLIIFTSKKLHDIVELGGTGWWKIDPHKARSATHVVLTHNAHDKRRPGDPERHGDAFLVASTRDVIQDEDGRWLIQFDAFAETNSGLKWPGYRNPVNYANTEETLQQLEVGEWTPMRTVPFDEAQSLRRRDDASVARMKAGLASGGKPGKSEVPSFGETIEAYRENLAAELGVDPSSVRITVETSK